MSVKKVRLSALTMLGASCGCCGERTAEFLTFDHVNGDGAAHKRLVNVVETQNGGIGDHIARRVQPTETPGLGFVDFGGRRFLIGVLCWNCNTALGYHGACPHRPDVVRPICNVREDEDAPALEPVDMFTGVPPLVPTPFLAAGLEDDEPDTRPRTSCAHLYGPLFAGAD